MERYTNLRPVTPENPPPSSPATDVETLPTERAAEVMPAPDSLTRNNRQRQYGLPTMPTAVIPNNSPASSTSVRSLRRVARVESLRLASLNAAEAMRAAQASGNGESGPNQTNGNTSDAPDAPDMTPTRPSTIRPAQTLEQAASPGPSISPPSRNVSAPHTPFQQHEVEDITAAPHTPFPQYEAENFMHNVSAPHTPIQQHEVEDNTRSMSAPHTPVQQREVEDFGHNVSAPHTPVQQREAEDYVHNGSAPHTPVQQQEVANTTHNPATPVDQPRRRRTISNATTVVANDDAQADEALEAEDGHIYNIPPRFAQADEAIEAEDGPLHNIPPRHARAASAHGSDDGVQGIGMPPPPYNYDDDRIPELPGDDYMPQDVAVATFRAGIRLLRAGIDTLDRLEPGGPANAVQLARGALRGAEARFRAAFRLAEHNLDTQENLRIVAEQENRRLQGVVAAERQRVVGFARQIGEVQRVADLAEGRAARLEGEVNNLLLMNARFLVVNADLEGDAARLRAGLAQIQGE